jgi:alkanesulfonate monooxygenase SsuD/methylene tetrahydromethanopterin reductase-like flavin-dependent oxidoreductase (luciferase family)
MTASPGGAAPLGAAPLGAAALIAWSLEPASGAVETIRELEAHGVDLALLPGRGLRRADPTTVLCAAAAVTTRIGLAAGLSPWQQHPFLAARSLATLDAVSSGRAAWLVQADLEVATLTDDSGRWSPAASDTPATRAAALADHVAAARALWDSWEPDAIVADTGTGQYVDHEKVHVVDHRGPFYVTRGPLNLPRTPQGPLPLVAHVRQGSGTAALTPAARRAADLAEVVVVHAATLDESAALARAERRAGTTVLIAVRPLVGESVLAASAPCDAVTVAGSAPSVVDELRALADVADGLVITGVLEGLAAGAVLHGVVPELVRGRDQEREAGPRILRSRLRAAADVPAGAVA